MHAEFIFVPKNLPHRNELFLPWHRRTNDIQPLSCFRRRSFALLETNLKICLSTIEKYDPSSKGSIPHYHTLLVIEYRFFKLIRAPTSNAMQY